MATQSRYDVQVHLLVYNQDLPELPEPLRDDFFLYQQQLVRKPQNPPRVPSHSLTERLAGYRALDIAWEGNPNAYRLVYRVYEKPAPRRVLILSFDQHDSAYEKAKARAGTK